MAPPEPLLPNPERHWARPQPTRQADLALVERCLGRIDGPAHLLSGGLANLNIRVGERVLRVYRRDVTSLGKECALLRRQWRSFRIPAVLQRGPDFLVLEHVPHQPLPDNEDTGAAVGRALAEIHAQRFVTTGFLDAQLAVAQPLPDFNAALQAHVRALAEGPAAPLQDAGRIEACLARLGPLPPPVLLHGDFKASNLHLAEDGALLVLDWEFAYAGPALMDLGQLLRWAPSPPFCQAMEASYLHHGGQLDAGWRHAAEVLDLANLVGLLAQAHSDSRRVRDLRARMAQTLGRTGEHRA